MIGQRPSAMLVLGAILLLAASTIGACTAPSPGSLPATSAPVAPSPTSTATSVPSSSTPAGAPTVTPDGDASVWHYVVLGDSSQWGFGTFYAAYMEADLGVKVQVQDRTIGGLSSKDLLERLRTNQRLRSEIRNAEVITFSPGGPTPYTGMGCQGNCDPPNASVDALAAYKADCEAIVAEIAALRHGKPTLIRVSTYYCPYCKRWKEEGCDAECRPYWDTINAVITEVAGEHHIPFANLFAAFSGPDYDEDPHDKGYIGPDGVHANEAGQKVIADAFRKLGYATIVP